MRLLLVLHGALTVGMSIAGSLAILAIVRRWWPMEARRGSNDVLGAYSQVIGTIYAVMVAFMLYAVWTDLNNTDQSADREAYVTVSFYRLADPPPPPERTRLKAISWNYAQTMVTQEWPAMERGKMSPEGRALSDALWREITGLKPKTPQEQILADRLLGQLMEFMELRRYREIQVRAHL